MSTRSGVLTIRTEPSCDVDVSERVVLLDCGLDDGSLRSPGGGTRLDMPEGMLTLPVVEMPRLLEANDSGNGGMGGIRSTLRVGLCGLSFETELPFLLLGDPGSLLKV